MGEKGVARVLVRERGERERERWNANDTEAESSWG